MKDEAGQGCPLELWAGISWCRRLVLLLLGVLLAMLLLQLLLLLGGAKEVQKGGCVPNLARHKVLLDWEEAKATN